VILGITSRFLTDTTVSIPKVPNPTMRSLSLEFRLLLLFSLLGLMLKLYAAQRLGFGDAEALYASYAFFPQPAYLDHPGLIGSLARLLGQNQAPSPAMAHRMTACLSTTVPFLGVLAATWAGAPSKRAIYAGFALLAAPEIFSGLFGMTPDLLLAIFWLLFVGLFSLALQSNPASSRTLYLFLAAGVCGGLAFTSKVSAVFMLLAALVTLLQAHSRHHWKAAGPYLGIALALLIVSPVVRFEILHHFPMLKHRLLTSQTEAGFSFRNLGALLGGQLLYVSPMLMIAGGWTAYALFRTAPPTATNRWFQNITALSASGLGLLCLWSKVAEPHWFAPSLLVLPVAFACMPSFSLPNWLNRSSLIVGFIFSMALNLWVLTDWAPKYLGTWYQPKYDLANDMYAWKQFLPEINKAQLEISLKTRQKPVIVAEHWIIAAQIKAGLGESVSVTTPPGSDDDFANTWLPAKVWNRSPLILWVSDDRFPNKKPQQFQNYKAVGVHSVRLMRGGRYVRRLRLELLLAHQVI
jgi:hypothetical protein